MDLALKEGMNYFVKAIDQTLKSRTTHIVVRDESTGEIVVITNKKEKKQ